jgi:DNA-binding transcriptional LysR family regulator
MPKLDQLMTFIEVVTSGGFTAAGRRTNMPRSTVSLHIQSLEAELGVKLFKRSTRSVVLTDDGRRLFESVSSPLEQLHRAIDGVRSDREALKGLIRLTAPSDMPTRSLAEAMADFSRLHPSIRFETVLTNNSLNLVEQNIDIAIGIGAGRSQEAVERHVVDIEWSFVADAGWLEKNPVSSLSAIKDFVAPVPQLRCYLEEVVLGGKALPSGAICVDDHRIALDLVRQGCGVALLPKDLCNSLLDEGTLLAVFTDEIVATSPLKLVFPSRSDITNRVRAFSDHIIMAFTRDDRTTASMLDLSQMLRDGEKRQ